MAKKMIGGKPHQGLIWLAWLLATCGFAILLGGVAALQNDCGSSPITLLSVGGAVGYVAPVSCDKFFRYTWWITMLHFFVWFLVLVCLAAGIIHKWRSALVGMLAVTAVLLMDTANTYLYYNDIPNLSGTTKSRTRTVVAGSIIAAIADLSLLLLIGMHDEKASWEDRTGTYGGTTYTPTAAATTTVPVTTTTHTTATNV